MTAGDPRRVALRLPPPFVGRTTERASLERALAAARTGDAGVLTVTGEPGVGKTRLLDALVETAAGRSFQVLRGRCIEGGGIPYLALTAALLPQLRRASMLNRRVLGTGALVLANLAGEAAAGAAPLSATDHSQLAQALSRAIMALAARRPLLLVIDDIHWADADTLVAIEYLAFAIADETRRRPLQALMVLSSEPPVDPRTAGFLARVSGATDTRGLKLEPFAEIETHDLVAATAGAPCSPAFLGQLLAAGRGNPLLTIAILEEMDHAGMLIVRDGALEAATPVHDFAVAAAVEVAAQREVLRQPPSRQGLLAELALLGGNADLDELAVASGRDRTTVAADIAALVAGGVLVHNGAGVDFAASIVRRAAVQTIPPDRRQQAHADMGLRLYGVHGLAPPHLLQLGRQLLLAGPLVRPEIAVPVLEAAAARAQELFAFGASAELYEAALARSPRPGEDVECAELHFECGRALSRNGDYTRSSEHFLRAAAIFRTAGRADREGEALAGWGRQFTVLGQAVPGTERFEAYLAETGEAEPGARAMVLAVWADSLWNERDDRDLQVATRAAALAASAGHDLAGASANVTLGNVRLRVMEPVAALAAFRESARFAARLASPVARAWGPVRAAMTNLVLGDLEAALADARAGEECARSGNDWMQVAMALTIRVSVSSLRGEFDDAEMMASEASMALARSGYRPMSALLFPTLAWMRALRGQWQGASDAAAEWEAWGAGGTAALLRDGIAALHAPAGAADRYEIHSLRPPWRRGLDIQTVGPLGIFTMLGYDAATRPPPDYPFAWLEAALAAGCRYSTAPPFSIDRILGIGLAAAGRPAEALAALVQAEATAEGAGARAELALVRAARALVMVRREGGEAAEAGVALLNQAVADFEELGMWGAKGALVREAAEAGVPLPRMPSGPGYPDRLDEDDMRILEAFARGRDLAETATDLLLDRSTVSGRLAVLLERLALATPGDALAYLDERGLEPASRRRVPEPTGELAGHVFLFTDIDNSTPLTNALGDDAYVRLLDLHDRAIEEEVAASGGNVVKHTGDGYFVEFGDADTAIACARAIQERFPLSLPGDSERVVRVGIGLHAGGAVERGFDFYGIAVIMAARICALADGGEILATAEVRAAASPGRWAFVDRGRFPLKGFSEQVRVYALGAS